MTGKEGARESTIHLPHRTVGTPMIRAQCRTRLRSPRLAGRSAHVARAHWGRWRHGAVGQCGRANRQCWPRARARRYARVCARVLGGRSRSHAETRGRRRSQHLGSRDDASRNDVGRDMSVGIHVWEAPRVARVLRVLSGTSPRGGGGGGRRRQLWMTARGDGGEGGGGGGKCVWPRRDAHTRRERRVRRRSRGWGRVDIAWSIVARRTWQSTRPGPRKTISSRYIHSRTAPCFTRNASAIGNVGKWQPNILSRPALVQLDRKNRTGQAAE